MAGTGIEDMLKSRLLNHGGIRRDILQQKGRYLPPSSVMQALTIDADTSPDTDSAYKFEMLKGQNCQSEDLVICRGS